MSDHKRCRACGRIEETTERLEHEERMQARIERHRAIHPDPWADEARGCEACSDVVRLDRAGAIAHANAHRRARGERLITGSWLRQLERGDR